MCNLGHAVFVEGVEQGMNEGLAKGRSEGLAEGHSQGLAEGRREGRGKLLTAVCSIMDKLGLNLDEALNALSIPETERQYFINAINNGVCE